MSDTRTVTFPAGENSATERFTISNDAIAEGLESFEVVLSSIDPPVNVPRGESVATVNIEDTDSKYKSSHRTNSFQLIIEVFWMQSIPVAFFIQALFRQIFNH